MELCPGMQLSQLVKKEQGVGETLCRIIFRQLAQGVAHMHAKHKAHRDLKLNNILFDNETNSLKIIDFGFAVEARPE